MGQENKINLIEVQPFTRINEGWVIKDPYLMKILKNFHADKVYSNFKDDYHLLHADPALYQRAFLHVVTETIYHYPRNANGEKTFKPIACMRPFVLVSLPNALQDLKNLGFKTFNHWWDESYDTITDPTERLYRIFGIIKTIAQKNTNELKEMLIDMQPVLEHNYNYYYDNFLQDQCEKFYQSCLNNLKTR